MNQTDPLDEIGQNVMRQVGVDSDDAAIWAEAKAAINAEIAKARVDELTAYANLEPEDLTGKTDHFTNCKLCLEPSHHCMCDQVVYAINFKAKERIKALELPHEI